MSVLVRCHASSAAAAEPLIGTAVERVQAWLLVEVAATWGKKGLEDTPLPEAVRTRILGAVAATPGVRPQLIRTEESAERAGVTVMVVRPGGASESLLLPSLEALEGIDLAAWLLGNAPVGTVALPDAPVLVCSHTKRDACCAEFGLPFYRALREELGARVWQSTHLGGHRFAATLVTLSDGYQYGRLRAEQHCPAMAKAIRDGHLGPLETLRGRTTLGAAEQVADHEIRSRNRLLGANDVRVLGSVNGPDGRVLVTLAVNGSEQVVGLRRVRGETPLISSCGAADPTLPTWFEVM